MRGAKGRAVAADVVAPPRYKLVYFSELCISMQEGVRSFYINSRQHHLIIDAIDRAAPLRSDAHKADLQTGPKNRVGE